MEFKYLKISKDTIEITGFETNRKEIIIPKKIDGLKVTHIGDWAFYNNQLASVEIPDSVTHIGDWAFGNNQLTSVEIPNSVTHIGYSAFGNNQLTSVEIPNSVTHIGDWAFYNNQLSSVEIPDSVTHIGDWAFDNNQLSSVEIPDSVTHIGDRAFRDNQLSSVEIPDSVTHIGDWAFDNNINIIQSNHKIQMIDGIATIIQSKKKRDEFSIYEGSFFNSKDKCYIAKRGEYYAHGETIREAIEDVNFKFLQENLDVQKLVEEIKENKTISVTDFRLLTGACRNGCRNFLKSRNLTETTYSLSDALVILENQYGWSRIKELFTN